jgi:hypothetical protein
VQIGPFCERAVCVEPDGTAQTSNTRMVINVSLSMTPSLSSNRLTATASYFFPTRRITNPVYANICS